MTTKTSKAPEHQTFVHVVVDPHHWYPLEMTLQNCPKPGFPEDYVIACKRSKQSGIRDESRSPYDEDERFGEWDQRISYELFRKILMSLDSAQIRAFPLGQQIDWFCQGPPGQTYQLTYQDRTHEWTRYEGRNTGWESLEEAIELMLAAVMYPVYAEQPKGLISMRREIKAEDACKRLEIPEREDD